MQVLALDGARVQEYGRDARVRKCQLRDEDEQAYERLPEDELQRHRARLRERQVAQLVPNAWRPALEAPLGHAFARSIASSRRAW